MCGLEAAKNKPSDTKIKTTKSKHKNLQQKADQNQSVKTNIKIVR